MKRLFLTTAVLAALSAGCGRGTGATGAPDSADLLVRWHFAGTAALAGDTNAAALRTVLAQPSTRAVLTQALSRLALAPETRPLAPLLNDLLTAESFVEARGEAARPDWTFALRLPPDRAGLWLTNWTAAAAAWQRPNAQAVMAGDWVVAAVGGEQLPGFAAVRARLAKTGRPTVQAEPGAWLELEANVPRLAPALGLPANVSWPHAHFAWAGRGQNVRTAARFSYDRPLELPLEPWRLPTNTVREPLLSFTAVQGVRPWLAAQPLLAELSLPAPNQVFSWAKSPAPYETLFAWELADAPAWIQAAQAKLKPALRSRLPWLDFGELRFVTDLNRLLWQGFPIIVPFVNPAPDPGFVVAGIFPVVSRKEAAPAELYDQFRGRTNLVLYDWEITQPRLGNWQALGMLHGMLARYTPPATNTPARLWLQDTNVTRHLGNTVTELTRVSPRELAGVRTSAIGFTAFELQWLARWLDGSRFPHLTPPERPAPRTRPAARGTTNAPSPRP